MTDTQTTQPYRYNSGVDLLDILVILAESWRLLVFGPLIVGVLAGVLSFLWPKTYESMAIARLTEEEAALFHAASVLDPLADKFGYLKRENGIRDDARNAVKKDLTFTADRKTKLVTVLAKGSTPEEAQALSSAAFDVLFVELVPKGKEKEAIQQEIAINNQLIADGILYADRSTNKQNLGGAGNPGAGGGASKPQIANLKLNNLELSLKLQAKGSEVFVQAPSLPQRKISPKSSLMVLLAVLVSGFALLVFVFIRKAWQAAAQNETSFTKMAIISKSLTWRSSK
jgi:capsular polysaccharide biosynthesis protein